MKSQTKYMAPEVLMEEYRRLLQEGSVDALPLIVSGNSMTPFLINGRDTVYLSRLERPARRGDILLYRRRSGSYVLHRVYRVTAEGYTMVGDNQQRLEPGIREDQVLALVTRVERKGVLLEPGCPMWDFFEKVWIRLVPLRKVLHRLYSNISRLFRK